MTLQDLFIQARDGIVTHRLRATLSSIGIVVGVGTVVASLAIGEGARRSALADLGALGIDNLYARAVVPSSAKDAAAPVLTREDADAIRYIAGVTAVAVTRSARVDVASASAREQAMLAGVTPAWKTLTRRAVRDGRWLSDEDERLAHRVAIVGDGLARRLFAGVDPLSRRIMAGGQIFQVVGVLAPAASTGGATLQSFAIDDSLLVPVSTMDQRLGSGDRPNRVTEIGVHLGTGVDADAVSRSLTSLLRRRHQDAPDAYELVLPRELLRARLQAQRTFDAVLLATGFIALIISGVGIMNVMLASVAERTPEIGARRAFGARRVEIVAQFALEAALLCVAGGLTGVPVGAALAWGVSVAAHWPIAISPTGLAAALALATLVGLAFGVYPAHLAARTDPIEALRA